LTADEIRNALFAALRTIAPEVEPSTIDPHADLREEVDLDSMDFLNLVLAMDRDLNVSIPESDYPRIRTLEGWVTYLDAHISARS